MTAVSSEPKKQLRVFIMAWGWGVESLKDISLPSLMQRDNIPWLVNNGYSVTISCYTKAVDVARVQSVFAEALNGINAPPDSLNVFVGVAEIEKDDPFAFGMKKLAFLTECRYAMEQDSPVLFAAADAFYGNGSLRNICVYNRHPGMALGAPYSRVKRGEFLRMLGEYRAAFPGEPLPNAKLVDIALRCEISGFADSNTDMDKNSSFLSSGSFRKLTDDLHTAIFHLPSPVMFWPRQSDFKFFDVWCGGVFTTLDHLWPAKLMAENRWRTLASSDLFYLVELCDEKVEGEHEYALEEGRLHNEAFEMVLPNTLAAEQIIFTLRRKPYLS